MGIQPRFLLALGGFLAISASGPLALGQADSVFPQMRSAEHAFVATPEPGDRSDLSVEQRPDGTGSSPETSPSLLPSADGPSYPLVLNAQVQHFLDRFTRERREIVGLWLNRSGRYLGMIREVLRSRGLPEDLAFTAMIESGFNPVAVSRAGAVGLWQFMAGTARRYGLRVDQWVDERLDPEKSTFAAVAYLRDLHAQFGSWTLAQAAYNAGELNVARAIRATGSNDFWALSRSRFLKQETKEFVPQIQAATLIGRDPFRYGFEAWESTVTSFESVLVPPSIDLRSLAATAGVSLEMLRVLNPTLVRGVTPPGPLYSLKVPLGTGPGVLAALEAPMSVVVRATGGRGPAVSRAARKTNVHVVRPRDTVSSIARHYGVAVQDVLRWNSLGTHDPIRPGDRLRVTGLGPSSQRDRQASPR